MRTKGLNSKRGKGSGCSHYRSQSFSIVLNRSQSFSIVLTFENNNENNKCYMYVRISSIVLTFSPHRERGGKKPVFKENLTPENPVLTKSNGCVNG